MAPPDAQAAGASMVEPLSPMAPPDAQAAGLRFSRLLFSTATRTTSSDRLGTIDLPISPPV